MKLSEGGKRLMSEMLEGRNEIDGRNDCAVCAVALSTGHQYADAYRALEKQGRRKGRGAYIYEIQSAVEDLGYEMTQVAPKDWKGAKTFASAAKKLKNGTYLIHKWNQRSGHIAALVDGDVLDWANGRRFQLREVYSVRPKWSGRGSQMSLF